MKFRMVHNNLNVFDLDKSIKFYQDAFDMHEVRRINAKDGSFIIVYLEDGSSSHQLELAKMAFKGRWIMIASLAGGQTSIDLEQVWRKRLKLIGSTLRSRTNEEKSAVMQSLHRELSPFFSSGKLINQIHAVFPIAEVEAAQAILRRAENIGKVVLTLD